MTSKYDVSQFDKYLLALHNQSVTRILIERKDTLDHSQDRQFKGILRLCREIMVKNIAKC